jgi:hypothetical protein
MRKVLILAVPLAFLLGCEQNDAGLLSPDDAVLSSQAADRATGSVLRERDGQPGNLWTLEFDAHGEMEMKNGQLRDAKGSILAERPEGHADYGDYWTASVSCAFQHSDGSFLFGGPFGDRNTNLGSTYVMLRVIDGGSPGAGVDVVWSGVTNDAGVLVAHCTGNNGTTALWHVIDGNLTVHQ